MARFLICTHPITGHVNPPLEIARELEWGEEVFWRVDWILTRDGTRHLHTSSSTIVRDAAPPLYPSDHYPVVSELVVL